MSLVDLLRNHREALLARWGTQTGRSTAELRDHVSGFLVHLEDVLREGPPREAAALRALARERARRMPLRPDFDLESVVREYGLLREALVGMLREREARPSLDEMDCLAVFFEEGVAEAVARGRREEREERVLSSLFTQSLVAIAVLEGPEYTFVFANPAYRALVGGVAVVGKPLFEALPALRGQGFDALLARVVATGEPFFGREVAAKLAHHGEDEWLYANFSYQPRFDASGRVDGVLVSAFDVTEQVLARRQVEALAREREAAVDRLRVVTDSLPALVCFVTADERYGFINKAYEDWFGRPRAAMLGQRVREVIGEAPYTVMAPLIRRGLSGESFAFEEHNVPHHVEGRRDVHVSFVAHRDAAGVPDGYVGLIEDVTHRRQLEAERDRLALQRTEILESLGDAFLALDREWRLVLVNRHHEWVTATRREDTLGRVLWEVFPEWAGQGSPRWREFRRCMEDRVEVGFVVRAAPLDAWTDVRAFPTREGGIAVFSRDVTQAKRAEVLLQRQREFEQQLIGIVSHDLRNPLAAIQMEAAQLARREALSARDFRSMGLIQTATARALRLVRDLLDFTQARLGGGIRLHRRPGDLHALARDVLQEVLTANPGRAVTLHCVGDGAGEWDVDRLGQVVQNLVTNALRYGSPGTRILLETRGGEQGMSLSVHNLGEPIAPDRLESIFQPMQRGPDGRAGQGGSVGLGLHIVQCIVQAHAGTVEVTSSASAGTRFTVRLPRRAPSG